MSREIRFRAWDGSNMLEPVSIEQIARGDNSLFVNALKERYQLMQYTGLKDKNGRDVYESDIVRIGKKSLGNNRSDDDYRTLRIVWNPERAAWVFDSEYMRTWNAGIWTDLQVIGNIYENPELLQ